MSSQDGVIADYRAAIRDKQQRLERAICRGQCENHEHYKAQCAELKAYDRALELFAEVLKRYFDDEGETNNLETMG